MPLELRQEECLVSSRPASAVLLSLRGHYSEKPCGEGIITESWTKHTSLVLQPLNTITSYSDTMITIRFFLNAHESGCISNGKSQRKWTSWMVRLMTLWIFKRISYVFLAAILQLMYFEPTVRYDHRWRLVGFFTGM